MNLDSARPSCSVVPSVAAAAALQSCKDVLLCCLSLWRDAYLAWKGGPGWRKKDGKTFQMSVAEDAKVCISCLLLCNKLPQILWLKTTSLSYPPVSVSQGLSTV